MSPPLSSSSSSSSNFLLSLLLLFFTSHFSPLLIFFSCVILFIHLPPHSHLLSVSFPLVHFSIPFVSLSYNSFYCPLSPLTSLSLLLSFHFSFFPYLSSFSFPLSIISYFLLFLLLLVLFSPLYPHPRSSNASSLLPVCGLPALARSPSTWGNLGGHVKLRSTDQP